ncbi:MAG: hypothetical protein LRZ84_14820 [Desertifilum sp.]|nr:hypothetical protein [Desertifilum sp.]
MLALLRLPGLRDELGSLLFDDNSHLLNWEADLVRGGDREFSSARPDSFPIATMDDWAYPPSKDLAVGNEKIAPKSVPSLSARELREQLIPDSSYSQNLAIRGGFARPTLQAAFNLRQEIPEEETTLSSIWGVNFDVQPNWESVKGDYRGAFWGLSRVSQEFLGFDIVPESLCMVFGNRMTPEFHKLRELQTEYLLANLIEMRRIEAAYSELNREVCRLEAECSVKLALGQEQVNLWSERGKVPVRNETGEIEVVLTAINYAVALTAINRITRLGIALKGFVLGAREVLGESFTE